MQNLLRVPEAAARLAVREATIRKWMKLRYIRFHKIGGAVRISESEIDRLLSEGAREILTTSTSAAVNGNGKVNGEV